MTDCIFCKIVAKEIPSQVVYEDEEIMAFNDIHPIAPIHILIIPKKHLESVKDITEDDKELLGKMFVAIQRLAAEKGIADKGFRVVTNSGPDGGQVVGHLHFHLIGGKTLGSKIG